MSTLQQLRTYYADALHVPYGSTAADLDVLAADVDAGRTSFADAALSIERRTIATTEVATLSYQFFTGATLKPSGLDYLLAPGGPNPTNLNSAYYASFNLENRFINFAVNLGEAGEGASGFAASYGPLSLSDTTAKAYADIFGVAPTADKVAGLLAAPVPDGRGGTYTRADYFADIGLDGPNGAGTKAALVGWLLAEASKADLGPYAKAYDAFIADLAPDGLARFNVDLLATYGPAPASTPGVTISFAANQSVAPDAGDPALRSTAGADTITGANGLDASHGVAGGDGADVITVAGNMAGLIDAGPGRDQITLDVLKSPVAVLGVAQNGAVLAGAGDDRITVGTIEAGAVIDGGAGDDTLVTRGLAPTVVLRGVEHVQATWSDQSDLPAPNPGPGYIPPLYAGPQIDLSQASGVKDVTNASPGVGQVVLTGLEAGTILVSRNTSAGLSATFRAGTVGADLYLDGARDGSKDNAPLNSDTVTITGATGALHLHVVSDSVVDYLQSGGLSGLTSLVIDGVGRFTEGGVSLSPVVPNGVPTAADNRIDASASAGVDLGVWYPSAQSNTVVLSQAADTLTLALAAPANTNATLGGGADVLTIGTYSDVRTNATLLALTNLTISGGRATTYATVTDFQKGTDHLDLLATSAVKANASVGPATTLEQALTVVSTGLAAGGVATFEFGGDTWVYHQDATVGADTGDGLIRLVGVTGLATGVSGGSADIRFG